MASPLPERIVWECARCGGEMHGCKREGRYRCQCDALYAVQVEVEMVSVILLSQPLRPVQSPTPLPLAFQHLCHCCGKPMTMRRWPDKEYWCYPWCGARYRVQYVEVTILR